MAAISPKDFERFYRDNYQPLLVYGLLISSDRELAKDVIQDAMLDFWQRLEQGQQIQQPLAYLKTSIRRELIRRQKRQLKLKSEERESPLNVIDDNAEQIKQEERLLAIQQAMKQLSKAEREVLQLKYQQAYSYEEIAARTGKSKRTIYNQVFKAIRKLQRVVRPGMNLLLPLFLATF